MKRLMSVLLAAALLLAACSPLLVPTPIVGPGSAEATGEPVVLVVTTTAGDRIYFPRQAPTTGERETMTALIIGELAVVNGCLRVIPSDSDSTHLLIWPPDLTLRAEEDTFQIRNGADQVVARVGDEVTISGGEIWSVELLDMRLQQSLPTDCPGPYWIVGAEVRARNPSGVVAGTVPADRPPQLRLENAGTVALGRVVVIFPHDRIIFGPLPPGTTSAYQSVPGGVYSYAAYEVEADGKTITQPVEDWVGEQPLAGTHFTYVLTVSFEQPEWQQIRAEVRIE